MKDFSRQQLLEAIRAVQAGEHGDSRGFMQAAGVIPSRNSCYRLGQTDQAFGLGGGWERTVRGRWGLCLATDLRVHRKRPNEVRTVSLHPTATLIYRIP